MKTQYDSPSSCNYCGEGENEYLTTSYDGYRLCECKTKCKACGAVDYWAYGFFESGTEIVGKCEKYSFGEGL